MTTPAEVFRQVLGYRDTPELVARFNDELPDREQRAREFHQAWGLADGRGLATRKAWEAVELREQHRQHLSGQLWVSVTETEERELVRRMRASQAAESAAASSLATRGPMSPAEVDAWRATAEGPQRGVPGAS